MSDVTWKKLTPGEWRHADTHWGDGVPYEIIVDTDPDGLQNVVSDGLDLPPDYAVCRAMPSPSWSQIPPTEPGTYWVWRPSWQPHTATIGRIWETTLPNNESYLSILLDSGERSTLPDFNLHPAWYMPTTVPPTPK